MTARAAELFWNMFVPEIAGIGFNFLVAYFSAYLLRAFTRKPGAAEKAAWAYACWSLLFYYTPIFFDRYLSGRTVRLVYRLVDVLGYVLMCAVLYAFDKRNLRQKIFLVVLMSIIAQITYDISVLPMDIVSVALKDVFGIPYNTRMHDIFLSLAFLLALWVIIWMQTGILRRVYARKKEDVTGRELALMILPILLCEATDYFFGYVQRVYYADTGSYITDANVHPEYLWLRAFYLMLSYGMIIVMVIFYQLMKKQQREERENAVLAGQIADLESHIHEVEAIHKDFSGLRHDMGNHIMTLEHLYQAKEWEEAAEYGKRLQETLEETAFPIKSANPVTDIILEEIRKKTAEKGIAFESKFFFRRMWGLTSLT